MAVSHLLRLPVELHLAIIDKLELHPTVNLAFTSRYFRSIIARPSHADYLVAETHSWARERALFACSGCAHFRRIEEFADDMRKSRYTRGGVGAATRLCLECGVMRGLYSPGTSVVIYGKPHVLCRLCAAFTERATRQAFCATCSPGSPVLSPSTVDDYSTHERMSTHSLRRLFGKTPLDELYVSGLMLEHDDDA
jgi:hypothetical protein